MCPELRCGILITPNQFWEFLWPGLCGEHMFERYTRQNGQSYLVFMNFHWCVVWLKTGLNPIHIKDWNLGTSPILNTNYHGSGSFLNPQKPIRVGGGGVFYQAEVAIMVKKERIAQQGPLQGPPLWWRKNTWDSAIPCDIYICYKQLPKQHRGRLSTRRKILHCRVQRRHLANGQAAYGLRANPRAPVHLR